MTLNFQTSYTAFANDYKLANGTIFEVAEQVRQHLQKNILESVLIFDTVTSQQVDLDFRGSAQDVTERLEVLKASSEARTKPVKPKAGRPKLGVVSREITLLPRHWEWLNAQSGGASASLRKLVEEARKKNAPQDEVRKKQDSIYKFMTAMAGDLPNYEEALRALYAGKNDELLNHMAAWSKDIREHIVGLLGDYSNQHHKTNV